MKHGPRELCRWLVAHGKRGSKPASIVRLHMRDFWKAAAVGAWEGASSGEGTICTAAWEKAKEKKWL